MAARKRKTDPEVVELIAAPVEDEIFDAMDKAIAASAEDVVEDAAPVEAVEESPKPEKKAKSSTKKSEKDTEPVAEPEIAPEVKPEVQPEVKSGKVSKSAEKSLEKGERKVFSARVYPSSVSKQVKYLAIGKVFILDTEVHDGRVIVSTDELGLKRGWADVTDLMG